MSSRLRRLGIEKVDTLVDVGAHHGGFIDEVKLDYSPSKILAIEPILEYRAILVSKGATVHNCAIGKDNERRQFHLYREDQASSYLPLLPGVSERYGFENPRLTSFDVDVRTLDNVINSSVLDLSHIDLLKIDVQGAELDVLRCGRYAVRRSSHIIIECNCIPQYENGSTVEAVIVTMKAFGFTLAHLFAPNCGVDNNLHYDERIMLHCDAHFVKA